MQKIATDIQAQIVSQILFPLHAVAMNDNQITDQATGAQYVIVIGHHSMVAQPRLFSKIGQIIENNAPVQMPWELNSSRSKKSTPSNIENLQMKIEIGRSAVSVREAMRSQNNKSPFLSKNHETKVATQAQQTVIPRAHQYRRNAYHPLFGSASSETAPQSGILFQRYHDRLYHSLMREKLKSGELKNRTMGPLRSTSLTEPHLLTSISKSEYRYRLFRKMPHISSPSSSVRILNERRRMAIGSAKERQNAAKVPNERPRVAAM